MRALVVLVALAVGLLAGGCIADGVGAEEYGGGFVPWWVEDGVPNGAGLIVK